MLGFLALILGGFALTADSDLWCSACEIVQDEFVKRLSDVGDSEANLAIYSHRDRVDRDDGILTVALEETVTLDIIEDMIGRKRAPCDSLGVKAMRWDDQEARFFVDYDDVARPRKTGRKVEEMFQNLCRRILNDFEDDFCACGRHCESLCVDVGLCPALHPITKSRSSPSIPSPKQLEDATKRKDDEETISDILKRKKEEEDALLKLKPF